MYLSILYEKRLTMLRRKRCIHHLIRLDASYSCLKEKAGEPASGIILRLSVSIITQSIYI